MSERERETERKERTHAGERVREKALWLLLLYVFSSTWACPMQIGLSQECCLFCLKSSFWSSDLPCLLATAILDSFSLFYLPNNPMDDVGLCETLWTVAHQAPLSMGFSRQEYWSGLPCLSPGRLAHLGIKPSFLCLLRCQVGSLPVVPPGKPQGFQNRYYQFEIIKLGSMMKASLI